MHPVLQHFQKLRNKQLFVIAVVALLVVGGSAVAYAQYSASKNAEKTTAATPKKKKKVGIPDNVVAVQERPYIKLLPLADGRNIIIEVASVKKPATSLEYELEYQAGTLLQGAFGVIELAAEGSNPQTKVLFGSCSAGGACTYHQDVKGGTMRAILMGGGEDYAVKSEWKYNINNKKATTFVSSDEKFSIKSDAFAKQSYVVVYNTPGLPAGLTGTPVSDPFSVTVTSTLEGKGTVTITGTEAPTAVKGWNGSEWVTFNGAVDGSTITADVDLMELFVAVK